MHNKVLFNKLQSQGGAGSRHRRRKEDDEDENAAAELSEAEDPTKEIVPPGPIGGVPDPSLAETMAPNGDILPRRVPGGTPKAQPDAPAAPSAQ